MTTDFAHLYLQLGIRHDCSLDEFKQACRRSIRQQHPDRLADGGSCDTAQFPLTELLTLYAQALRFHRKHGRLPGAAATTNHPVNTTIPPTLLHARPERLPAPARIPRRMPLRAPLLIMVAVTVGFVVVNLWNGEEPVADAPAADQAPAATAVTASLPAQPLATQNDQPAVATPSVIEIGMDAETVRAIQGDPQQWDASEWIYGPSWIRFERGRVIDWYSSPLHRLKTATNSPS